MARGTILMGLSTLLSFPTTTCITRRYSRRGVAVDTSFCLNLTDIMPLGLIIRRYRYVYLMNCLNGQVRYSTMDEMLIAVIADCLLVPHISHPDWFATQCLGSSYS
ncbi:hypothetical protein HBI56_078060 [Parastagonospora nodorum]|uniref:Secreted protein n=1 Tax=Phaeosphaeria nodorum (strain SN15 / ATCC MYA-4574 / FGSC 10173) TaxID=321614 RepID=A0A7U2EW05_PHANO|nr:hypothetical protein HBH56_149120 [Parastagonospora nodorum]QRC94163.1 hypothetical protein JI435_405280 [Parastagonospora nodorum SN15]KAH3923171.1 hypothetical protein HBH54_213760 [Parastagonospora nodorum]KAH3945910.1 hypothetical protein HBH53_136560 [Parastagonospora nodorum]KAH3984008.1 hypothetical protein HBH52_063440 [Parastagonospora nodorum]